MQKIISLFQRNYDGDRLVRDELVDGAEWVPAGEGVATRKWDGTAWSARSPANSLPMNSHAFLPITKGLIARSERLLLFSSLPSLR